MNEVEETVQEKPKPQIDGKWQPSHVHIELKHPVTWGEQRRFYYELPITNSNDVFLDGDDLVINYKVGDEFHIKRIRWENYVDYTIMYR